MKMNVYIASFNVNVSILLEMLHGNVTETERKCRWLQTKFITFTKL